MARFKGDKGPNTRKLPKSKPRKKGRRGKGSSWGLFGVAASIITSAAVAILRLSKQRKVDSFADRNALRHMLLRPLQITEHGACRMDCRSVNTPLRHPCDGVVRCRLATDLGQLMQAYQQRRGIHHPGAGQRQ